MPTIRRLFLIDGLGAVTTALLLSFLLAPFEAFFGMPAGVVYPLAALAGIFAIYSFSCYFLKPQPAARYLRIIAFANLAYCVITTILVVLLHHVLTGWGIAYFIGEIAIIIGLVSVELRAAARKSAD